MKEENKKQTQRRYINEAMKEFLSKGGKITKIELTDTDESGRFNAVTHDPEDLLDMTPESAQIGSLKILGGFDGY